MRTSQRGVVLENHEIEAINTKMGEQGYYKQEINKIMKEANRLTYKGPDGTVYKGFENIIRAMRRGNVPSDILDTAKFAKIYSDLTRAYARSKRLAENSLDPVILNGIREREYDLMQSNKNQASGNIDAILNISK